MPTDRYTHGHHASVLRSHTQRTAENSAAYLLPELRPGLSLLDVGCGPGTITCDLAEAVAPGIAVGLDFDEGVLVGARERAAERGLSVEFEQGDVYALRFDDDTFDVVHAHQVLQHLSDPVAALREMRRVCKPGGVIAVRDGDYEAFTWFPPDPILDNWLRVYRNVCWRNNAEPDAGRRLLHWARAAGFSEVKATASVWCFADEEMRTWWGETWAERAVSSAFAHQAVEYGLATREDLQAMSDAFKRWAKADDGWFIIPHGEILARVP